MPPVPVLLAHTYPLWGGDKAQMVDLAASLDPRRWAPVVLTTTTGPLTDACAARGIPTVVLPMDHFRRGHGLLGYLVRGPLALRRLVRDRRVALLHACCDYSTIPLERTARRHDLPFIQHVQDTDRAWMSRKKAPAVRRADAIVGCSRSVVEWLVARGAPADRATVVYNSVDLAPYEGVATGRDAVRAAIGLATGDLAIGVFARLERARKGQDEMLRAVARLAAELPVHLVLVGEDDSPTGDDERALRALASALGIEHRVHMLGQRRDVPRLMAAMDVLGAPFHREGFGRVVVEGMAAGLPVAGFRDGALPEIVREGVDGFLVDEGREDQLAEAVRRLAGSAALRASLGAQARQRAADFSLARHVAAMDALYDAVLQQRRRR